MTPYFKVIVQHELCVEATSETHVREALQDTLPDYSWTQGIGNDFMQMDLNPKIKTKVIDIVPLARCPRWFWWQSNAVVQIRTT